MSVENRGSATDRKKCKRAKETVQTTRDYGVIQQLLLHSKGQTRGTIDIKKIETKC